MTLIIAHRTAPLDAPENSLEGIRKAAGLGADMVEVDLRRTLDGVAVLLHDPWLLRTLVPPLPWPLALTPDALARRLRLRGGDERLPLFAEALATLPPGLGMAIDIKDPSAAPATVDEVRRQGAEQRVLLWSQHLKAVEHCATEMPEAETSLLRDTFTPEAHVRLLDDAITAGARGVSAHWDAVSPEFMGHAEQRGLRVYAWCQWEERHAEKAGLGLAGVVTDWPREARAALG